MYYYDHHYHFHYDYYKLTLLTTLLLQPLDYLECYYHYDAYCYYPILLLILVTATTTADANFSIVNIPLNTIAPILLPT